MTTEDSWDDHELINPEHTAVIVIDMQNDTCKKASPLGRSGWDLSLVEKMAPDLAKFLSNVRKLGYTVIHTRNEHYSHTNSGTRSRQARKSKWPSFAEPSSKGADWYDEFEEFVPLPNEPIITKHRYSAFAGTDLALILRAKSIRTLVLTGVETHICVESTARSAFMEDFNVVLISNCTSTQVSPNQRISAKTMHEVTAWIIDEYFGTVMSSDVFLNLATSSTK